MRLQWPAVCFCAWVAAVKALAPANPFGWEETQPDGSPVGRLYLKGHPVREIVYVVDQHEYPVVIDDKGWYVYGSSETNDTSLRGSYSRQRELWYPTKHGVSRDMNNTWPRK